MKDFLFFRAVKLIVILFVGCVNLKCGLKEAKYEDYNPEPEVTLSEACQAALTAFETNLGPAMATCAQGACHAVQGIGGSTLSLTDHSQNRNVLLKFDGNSNGQTLYNKITFDIFLFCII